MTSIFNEQFKSLLNEADFTKEMLGSGATQIRKANYAKKGMYFQAFTSLATGLERIGKLCLMLDYYIETNGTFPDAKYFKKIGHNISLIYSELLYDLQYKAMDVGKDDIPYFNEIFAGFFNDDAYIKTRKTWDTI